MKKLGIIIWSVIVIGLGIGYVRGIVKFAKCDFKAPYKAEIVYGVGIATGLGCFIGWFNIPDVDPPAVVKEST